MTDLIISMETTCDFTKELIKKYDFKVLDMDFIINGEVYNTKDDDIVSTKLYERMEKNEKTSTSQINGESYKEFFVNLIKESKNVLHLAFSSGLSNTYISAREAAKEINEEYGANIRVVDSLGGGPAQGILGILAKRYAEKASNIDEVEKFANATKNNLHMLFTVDNLRYLVNGGRIKPSVAFVGNLLNIKPIIRVDDKGRLLSCGKVISRKKSLKTLFDDFMNKHDKSCDLCFISHANCESDAVYLKEMIENNTNLKPIITNLGPVLGSHAGPGTIALFFLGGQR